MTTDSVAALTDTITRRLPDAACLSATASEVAGNLLAIGRCIPESDWLILGGSMARGEPTWIHHHGSRLLISDLDLLYVHSGPAPSLPIGQLRIMAERRFSTVDIMVLSLDQYRILGTSLGYDFKNLGIDLSGSGLPSHAPVRLDDRDAYEILLYYVQAYYWHGLNEKWQAGLDTTQFHLLVNRMCMKVLRATGMLDGAYAHHDLATMAPHLAEQMRDELHWRAVPARMPMNPGRFWHYVHQAFRRFDYAFGGSRPDAVRLSRYAVTSSGQVIARHHRVANDLAREAAAAWVSNPCVDDLATVERAIWSRVTGWTGSSLSPGPAAYFAKHRSDIHDHLLAMKVQATAI
ncbi:hypothetical protein [Nocardia sp. NPDC057353]|uniref:hypothetical protein n=1 Tax=Nocardia sp. NPDC057353 TaxID=3346104 RepID=UPI00363D83D1